MIKYISIVLLLFLGCSGTDVVKKQNTTNNKPSSDSLRIKNEALSFFINGAILEAKGDYASAILEYQEALQRDESAGIYFSLAKNYYALGKYPSALQNARNAVLLSPEEKEYYSLLGDIYTVTRQPDSAVSAYSKIIEMDSTDIPALYRLAGVYEKSKPSEAVHIYNRILAELGDEWNVLARLAELNEKLGNIKEAAENIKRMTEIDPVNPALKKLLSQLYHKEKNYDAAIETLNELIESTPGDYEARERKAQLYLEMNEWKKASEEYNFLLSLPTLDLEWKIKIGAAYFIQII
jgi:tetratricopeptide (TPR) repeat protein